MELVFVFLTLVIFISTNLVLNSNLKTYFVFLLLKKICYQWLDLQLIIIAPFTFFHGVILLRIWQRGKFFSTAPLRTIYIHFIFQVQSCGIQMLQFRRRTPFLAPRLLLKYGTIVWDIQISSYFYPVFK